MGFSDESDVISGVAPKIAPRRAATAPPGKIPIFGILNTRDWK
jgi:hypothetical protein